ncbi:hypothetical protein KC622_00650, partial [Candidatus Dojkabacteria bacterium]|nr:hypothetical protein [Candidatus Dojkabacteria bacterium]
MEILERFTSKILAMKKESLLIIVLLFLLAYILIFRLPNKQQFKETRDSERAVHVISLRDSLEEYFAAGDSQKILPMIPDCSTERITIGASGLSLETLVEGELLEEIPQDP